MKPRALRPNKTLSSCRSWHHRAVGNAAGHVPELARQVVR